MAIKFAPNANLDGQVVSAKITQNTRTAEAAVENWKNARTTPEITLTMYRPCKVALSPELICVEVTGWLGFDAPAPSDRETYDYRRHDIAYEWTITDESGNPPPDFAATRLMPHQRDAGKSYECLTARVLNAGTWTFSVTATEKSSGKTATASVSATVDDMIQHGIDNTSYEIFAVDPDSVWDGAPSGATLVTSFEDALDNWTTFGTQPSGIFLLPKGKTYTYSRATPDIGCNRNFYLGSYGPGTGKPVLQGFYGFSRNQGAGQSIIDFRVQGVRLEGGWDAVTESGNGTACLNLGATGRCTLVVDDSEFINFGVGIFNTQGGTNDFGVKEGASTGVNNTVITGFKDFGMFCHAGSITNTNSIISLTGVDIKANPLSNFGGPKEGPFNTHGPIRIRSIDVLNMEGCDMFSCMSWFPTKFPQPCMRLWTTMTNTGNNRGSVSRCVLEGGTPVVQSVRANAIDLSYPINLSVTFNYILGGANTRQFIGTTYSGIRAENNVFVSVSKGDVGDSDAFSFPSDQDINALPEDTTMWENPAAVARNNTVVELRTNQSNLEFIFDPSKVNLDYVNVEDSNNIIFAPNRTDVDFGDWTPMDTITLAFAPLFARWGTDNPLLDTDYPDHDTFEFANVDTPATDVIVPRPQAGSAAIGTATGYAPMRDFFLDLRPANPSKGAIESAD